MRAKYSANSARQCGRALSVADFHERHVGQHGVVEYLSTTSMAPHAKAVKVDCTKIARRRKCPRR
jgi:hypothetical protein